MKKSFLFVALALLVVLAVSCKKPPEYLPDMEITVPPDTGLDIKTDYSGYEPYAPPYTMHSRLRSGPMPELLPSGDYGMLLPYVGAVAVTEYGGMQATKYGLVTMDGVIVTDGVYDSVTRAYFYEVSGSQPKPAYSLGVNLEETPDRWYQERLYGVCGLDGSWITPIDYISVAFSQNVIVLVRDQETLDIDVYDYNGKFLHNMKTQSWVRDVEPYGGYDLSYGNDSEGYGRVQMTDGTVAFVDLATGICRRSEYRHANGFSEGLAPASVFDDESGTWLWGYINTDLVMVIDPIYEFAGQFMNGRTVVGIQNYSHLINTRGEILLSIKDGNIDQRYDGTGYSVYEYETYIPTHYTNDLEQIQMSSRFGEVVDVYYMSDGWYTGDCYEKVTYSDNDRDRSYEGYIGKVLFSETEEYLFTDIWYITQFIGGYVAYTREVNNNDSSIPESVFDAVAQTEYHRGVMRLDGSDVIASQKDTDVNIVADGQDVSAFIVNVGGSSYYSGPPERIVRSYRLIGTNGEVIASGQGLLTYDEVTGLYTALAENGYSYLDGDGNVIISIPLMSYMLD